MPSARSAYQKKRFCHLFIFDDLPQIAGMDRLDILHRLIAFETVSADSNLEMIEFVAKILRGAGVAVEIIPDASGSKANLYATIGPADIGGVMLSGHADVVPVTGQVWSKPPFQLTHENGRHYGRGTTDMKGFLACALAMALRAAKAELKTPLHLAISYDEEIGCIGVRSLIDMLAVAPVRPRFCIVGEPTGMAVATGHKGKLAARATCRGLEAHSALAPTGLNAIHLAAEFVTALRGLQNELAQNGAKDGDYDVPYTTIHTGIIRGGVALNIVPNHCEVDFEIRNLAGDDAANILTRIRAAAAAIVAGFDHPKALIEIDVVNTYPGLDTPQGAAVVDFVKSLTGANGTMKVAFGTEAGLFDQRLGVPCVVCGPGSMAQGHKPDEYISHDQLAACDAALTVLLDRLIAGI